MYERHFGLQRRVFNEGIARDSDVFFGASAQKLESELTTALSTRDSVVVVTGQAGVGKTTVASHVLRNSTTRLALAWIGNTPLTAHELLEQLLTELGFGAYKHSRTERLQIWRQHLKEMSITDTKVCVMVDSAESFGIDVLAALASLTAADPCGCHGANVILASQSPLHEQLSAPSLGSLKQRIRLSFKLEPLDEREMRTFLDDRIRAAGSSVDKIFSDDAIGRLYAHSGGIFRVVNNLCETLLTVAAAEQRASIDAELVNRIAVETFGLGQSSPEDSADGRMAEPPAAQPRPQPRAAAPDDALLGAKPATQPKTKPATQPETKPKTTEQLTRPAADVSRRAPAAAEPRPIGGFDDTEVLIDERVDRAPQNGTSTRSHRIEIALAPDQTTVHANRAAETAATGTDVTPVIQRGPKIGNDDPTLAARPLSKPAPADKPARPAAAANRAPRPSPQDRTQAAPPAPPRKAEPARSLDTGDETVLVKPAAKPPAGQPIASTDETVLARRAPRPKAADTNGLEDLDLPVLTDSVKVLDVPDVVVDSTDPGDSANSKRRSASRPGAGDDAEVLDAQQWEDTLEALANAQQVEDFSNTLAEELFADIELEALGTTRSSPAARPVTPEEAARKLGATGSNARPAGTRSR